MNTVKKGTSPIILRVAPDKNSPYKIEDLWAKSLPSCHDRIKLMVYKAYEAPNGVTVFIDNVSDKGTEIELEINGAAARNSRGTAAMFMGHICGAVNLPGKPIRVSLPSSKEDDTIGFTEPTTFISFVWEEGSQTGEIRRYINSAYDVNLGTMHAGFPIDDPGDDRTPVPSGCIKPVQEDDINP